jgi:two-component system sensor histidine kinase/response regulator
MSGGSSDQRRLFLATALATQRERRIAVAFAAGSFVAFLAVMPFVRVPLPAIPAFIPVYEAAHFLIDVITAALLLDQSVRLRSIAIAALASG